MIDFKLFLQEWQFVYISNKAIPNTKLIFTSYPKNKIKLALSSLTVRFLIKPYIKMFSST